MAIYYLDTSALIKRYRTETGSDVVEELFEGLTTLDELTTSYLTLLEVNSTAARLLKGGVITPGGYRRILNQFALDISDYGFTLVPVQKELIDSATAIVREYPLRSLDAIHFASAIENRRLSRAHELYVISADRELVAACQSYGIPALDPQSNDALDRLMSFRRRVG